MVSELDADSSSPEYETKAVYFKQITLSRTRGKLVDDPLALVTTTVGVTDSESLHEPTYLVLYFYTQCHKRFPDSMMTNKDS